jgi:hypothetical protein
MKVITTTGLLTAALVLLGASDAAAQAPTLSVSANGASVTINWTAVAGATGYNLVVSGSLTADVNLPASVTNIVVNAPPGTYSLRVRATAGGQAGPFSNTADVTVGGSPGPGPCTPTAPTVTTAVNGGVVTVSWGAVPGAAGYQVQFSRFSGGTELVQSTTQTSYVQFVGMLGTFYVRVVALSTCGNATSSEQSFTITTLTGNLPRTPDPAPGTLLPKPSYGQDIVIALSNQYRGDLLNSCHETGGNNVFMFRVVNALRQRDSRWGMNQKRGNQGLSQDIATYNPTALPDAQAQQIYLWDIIGGHCGSNPTWNWGDVTAATWQGGQTGAAGCSNAWCALWYIPQEYFQRGFQ